MIRACDISAILPWFSSGLVPLSRRASLYLDVCDIVVYSLGHFQCAMASKSYAITGDEFRGRLEDHPAYVDRCREEREEGADEDHNVHAIQPAYFLGTLLVTANFLSRRR